VSSWQKSVAQLRGGTDLGFYTTAGSIERPPYRAIIE
jgi:hypothetical protein